MGLYSVFLGLGQVIGRGVGGVAASWKGIDGLVVATGGLLAVGILALVNLRAQESALLDGPARALRPPSPSARLSAIRSPATGDRRPDVRGSSQGGAMTVAIVTDSGIGPDPGPTARVRHPAGSAVGSVRRAAATCRRTSSAPEEFWRQMRAPDSPFAHTAAASAGQFKQVFEQAFEEGADSIVCVCL